MKEVLQNQPTQQEIVALKPDSKGTQTVDAPTVLRDRRGIVRWAIPGNTPEENEQLGIRNVQVLFLEKFPEFLERFPFGENGMISEERKEEAKNFINENLGSSKKVKSLTEDAIRYKTPYFNNNYRTALSKSFAPWGVIFDWEQQAPEGWMTTSSLARQLRTDWKNISKLANLSATIHPEWYGTYLDSMKRKKLHYSPELVNLVYQEFSKTPPAPEGWITNRGIAIQLQTSKTRVNKLASHFRKNNPEWFRVYRDSSGRPREHYSPELIVLITREMSVMTKAPEGWSTIRELSKILKRSDKTVKGWVNEFRKDHPESFRTYVDSTKVNREYHSPELVAQLIQKASEHQMPPDGWVLNLALSKSLNRGEGIIKRLAAQHKEGHPEWFGTYLDSKGRLQEYYSSELVQLVSQEATQYPPAPEGWMTRRSLSKQLRKDWDTVNNLAEHLGKDKPECLNIYLDSSGHPNEHLSPELVAYVFQEASLLQSSKDVIPPDQANEWIRKLLAGEEV